MESRQEEMPVRIESFSPNSRLVETRFFDPSQCSQVDFQTFQTLYSLGANDNLRVEEYGNAISIKRPLVTKL